MQLNTSTTDIWDLTRERKLVQKAQGGDQCAFELLVERYQASLARCISHYFQDYDQQSDLVQEVLLQLYLSLPTLLADRSLEAWLLRVAHNRCLDELRRKQQRPLTYFSELEGERDSEHSLPFELLDATSLDEVVEQHELQQRLRQAIECLPSRYRSVVWLRYTSVLSFVEIGQLLRIPVATTKTYFYRAKAVLRRLLGEVSD